MLEDVRHSGGVSRRGRKEHSEGVVVVSALDGDVASAGPLMLELEKAALERLEGLAPHDRVSTYRADGGGGGLGHAFCSLDGGHTVPGGGGTRPRLPWDESMLFTDGELEF